MSDAEYIRNKRKAMGLNQRDFAKKLGVTQATIVRWERGQAKPSRLAMMRLKEINKNETR